MADGRAVLLAAMTANAGVAVLVDWMAASMVGKKAHHVVALLADMLDCAPADK
jgi:hypothetical protein